MAIVYPEKLQLAQLPTPLHAIDRYSESLCGPRIWLKRDDLTGFATSGNKIRKLEFTLAHALTNGHDVIVTCGGIQSNHCRATALLSAQLGIHCSLVLRGEQPNSLQGNALLDKLSGARLCFNSVRSYQSSLNELLEEESVSLRNNGLNPYIIPTGASDGVGLWGYIACAEELLADFSRLNISPNYIVHATGSGGTQAGLTLGMHLLESDVQVCGINVCDNEAYFQKKVRSDIRDWQTRNKDHAFSRNVDVDTLPVQVIDGYVGEGYALVSDDVLQCIVDLARLEGIVLDPVYTGKAFYGLSQEIKKGRFDGVSDLIFVHTGGTFGLFAYEQQLNQFLNP